MSKASRLRYLKRSAGRDRCVPIYDAKAGSREVPLLKTLVSNRCRNSCSYCAFRCERRVRRERFDPPELAEIALNLWNRGDIQGVFLSSSVDPGPDGATRREVRTAEILRESGYDGYLHLKLMPGCNRDLVRRAVELSDRVGLNLESPDGSTISEVRPEVDPGIDIWRRLRWCGEEIDRLDSPGKVTIDTQFVVGAGYESDLQLLEASHELYEDLGLARVYYSGFSPVERTPLEDAEACPSSREFRLYQASSLLRDYPVEPEDLRPALGEDDSLRDADPKLALLESKRDLFPIDLNSASRDELQLAPGIGPKTARKIVSARWEDPFESLRDARKRIGLRKSMPFLSVDGERQGRLDEFLPVN